MFTFLTMNVYSIITNIIITFPPFLTWAVNICIITQRCFWLTRCQQHPPCSHLMKNTLLRNESKKQRKGYKELLKKNNLHMVAWCLWSVGALDLVPWEAHLVLRWLPWVGVPYPQAQGLHPCLLPPCPCLVVLHLPLSQCHLTCSASSRLLANLLHLKRKQIDIIIEDGTWCQHHSASICV